MKVWLVRAGKHGQDEETALTQEMAIIGFDDIGDLSKCQSLEEVIALVIITNPSDAKRRCEHRARQLWAFRELMKEGEIVVLPLKTRMLMHKVPVR